MLYQEMTTAQTTEETAIDTTAVEAAADTTTETAAEIQMDFAPSRFVDNLGYMGLGMLGIFVVIGLIVAATSLLNYITRPKK